VIIKLAKLIVIKKAPTQVKQELNVLEDEASDKIVYVPRSSTSVPPKRVVNV